MNKTRIKIQYVNQPKEGRKTGSIKTVDGAYYDVWPDKLAGLLPGAEYDIETTSREFNGKTYITATKLTKVNGDNGHSASNGNGHESVRSARIERQHSQEMAIRTAQIAVGVGIFPEVKTVNDLAKAIGVLTDYWQHDVGKQAAAPEPEPEEEEEGLHIQ